MPYEITDGSNFTSEEKVEQAFKAGLDRVQTDLKKEWFQEPKVIKTILPNQTYKNTIPSWNEIKNYLLIDRVTDTTTPKITTITVEQVLGTASKFKNMKYTDLTNGKYDSDGSTYVCRPSSDPTITTTDENQYEGLSPGMFTRYNYFNEGLTGAGSDQDEPNNALLTYTTDFNTINSNRIIGNTQEDFLSDLETNAIAVDIIAEPSDWDSVNDQYIEEYKHPFLQIYLSVPTFSSYSTAFNGSDNISFFNPVIENALGDAEGYPYLIEGWNDTVWNIITNESVERVFFNNTSGIVSVYGQENILDGPKLSGIFAPLVSYIKYTGETLADGIISQGTTLPKAELHKEKDLFINTTEDKIYRLNLNGTDKEWKLIGGSSATSDTTNADNITSGTLSADRIGDDSISVNKLVSSYDPYRLLVTGDDGSIAGHPVGWSKLSHHYISDNAITPAKIEGASSSYRVLVTDANGDVTWSTISADMMGTYSVSTPQLALDSVNESRLTTNAVTVNKIANSAVITAKIADSAVTTAKIANSAVTTAKIADDAITGSKLANDITVSTTGSLFAGAAAINMASDTTAGGNPMFALLFRRNERDFGYIGYKRTESPLTDSGDLTIGTLNVGLRFAESISSAQHIVPQNMATNAGSDNAISLGSSGARFKDLHLGGIVNVTANQSTQYMGLDVNNSGSGIAGIRIQNQTGAYQVQTFGGEFRVYNTISGVNKLTLGTDVTFTVDGSSDRQILFQNSGAGGLHLKLQNTEGAYGVCTNSNQLFFWDYTNNAMRYELNSEGDHDFKSGIIETLKHVYCKGIINGARGGSEIYFDGQNKMAHHYIGGRIIRLNSYSNSANHEYNLIHGYNVKLGADTGAVGMYTTGNNTYDSPVSTQPNGKKVVNTAVFGSDHEISTGKMFMYHNGLLGSSRTMYYSPFSDTSGNLIAGMRHQVANAYGNLIVGDNHQIATVNPYHLNTIGTNFAYSSFNVIGGRLHGRYGALVGRNNAIFGREHHTYDEDDEDKSPNTKLAYRKPKFVQAVLMAGYNHIARHNYCTLLGQYQTSEAVGALQTSGVIYCSNGTVNPSDSRIKKDIVHADVDEAYTIVQNIQVRKYKYTDNYRKSMHNNLSSEQVWGLIAQEVESVFPEAVSTSKQRKLYDTTVPTESAEDEGSEADAALDPVLLETLTEFKQLEKQKLVFPLIGAVQKLMQLNSALEARVAALETQLSNTASV